MLLRTRLTLIVCLSSLSLAGALLAEGRWRLQLAERDDANAHLTAQLSVWSSLVARGSAPLLDLAQQVARSDSVAHGLADGEARLAPPPALASAAAALRPSAQIEVMPVAGTSGAGAAVYDGVLSGEVIDAVRRRSAPVVGLLPTQRNRLAIAAVVPIYSRTGISGVVAVWALPDSLLKESVAILKADAALVDRDGRFSWVPNGDNKPKLAAQFDAWSGRGRTIVDDNKRMLGITWTEVTGALGATVGSLLTVEDVTKAERDAFVLSIVLVVGLASILALFVAFLHWYLRQSFTPLNGVIAALNGLARGDRSVSTPVHASKDEIGRLSSTMDQFRHAIEAREQLLRIRQDLEAAREIQHAILPSDFPDRPTLAVAASMVAARDVGGDFFDFFDLHDGRFGFVIADTSGKGMAAALFMAVARTAIRSTALLVADPGACLAEANDFLATNNSEMMFVTAFYGILDVETGRVVYANGGHNPPFRISAEGGVQPLAATGGRILAIEDSLVFDTAEIVLKPGERIFLYTDGVTEADDPQGGLFGADRLELLLNRAAVAGEGLIEAVMKGVELFAAGTPQADDITCLTLTYRGAGEVVIPLS